MRRLPLLVLLYVMLDFANPLMPGAVRFEAGAVESVQADRAGREAAVMPVPAALWTRELRPPDGIRVRPVPAPAVSRRTRRAAHRVVPPSSDPSPSPTEDH
jgi:hypothetical protein